MISGFNEYLYYAVENEGSHETYMEGGLCLITYK